MAQTTSSGDKPVPATELPGGKWPTPREARLWLKSERARLGWSHKDVERAFWSVASQSRLYIGPGGGPLFNRATEARVRRFEDGGSSIPDWLYWIPLAIQRSDVPRDRWWEWDRAHIPRNSDLEDEHEDADWQHRTPHLDDEQLELLARYAALSTELRAGLRQIAAAPAIIREILIAAGRHRQTVPEPDQ